MPLYKYVTPERFDVLENGFVRFTQPYAFNDPFETFPCFTAGLPDNYIHDNLAKNKIDKSEQENMLKASFEQKINKYPGAKIPFEAIKDSPFVKELLNQFQPISENLFTQLMSSGGSLFQSHTIKAAREAINKQFGALCLTENPFNLLMWAHYSANHTGFVLEFDEKHPFFDRRAKPGEFGRYLKKVQYTKIRPQAILFDPKIQEEIYRATWVTNIFFSKSAHWAYEEEWRIIEYLKDCPRILKSEPYDIYLFPIPTDCISGIIFGCRTLETTKSIINKLVCKSSSYSHIRLMEAIIDEKEYKLNFLTIH